MAKVIMYKKNPCPYCDRAEIFFKNRDIKIEIVDLTNNMDELNRIKTETGWKTVPIIMIDGKLIGGYNDLKVLDDEGKLDVLLK